MLNTPCVKNLQFITKNIESVTGNIDEDRIVDFAKHYQTESPNTQRRYEMECYKLLHYLRSRYKTLVNVFEKTQPIDALDYMEFLKNPTELDNEFLIYRKRSGTPFSKPLTHNSIKGALSILYRFFYYFGLKGEDNPFFTAKNEFNKIKIIPPRKADILTRADVKLIFDYVETLPRMTLRDSKKYHQTRWLLSLIYYGFFKTTEIKKLRMGQFYEKTDCERWYMIWPVAKNEVHVPICERLIKEMFFYRSFLGLRKQPSDHEKNNCLITGLYKNNNPLSAESINIIIKNLFNEVLDYYDGDEKYHRSLYKIAKANAADLRKAGIYHALSNSISNHKYRLIYAQVKKTTHNDLLIV